LPQLLVEVWLQLPAPEQNDGGWYVVPLHDDPRPQLWVVGAWVQAPAPLQVPVLPQGGLAAHCPDGAEVPAGRLVQVPGLPETLQAWQLPQLALPQQTPSMQLPLMHWVPPVQVMPLALSAQFLLVVPWQVYGARQSESPAHGEVLQTPVPQTYGEQLCVVGAAQLPLPLQCETGVNVEPLHEAVPQATVVAASWQAPAPLQSPVLPQGGFAAQRPCGSAVPIATLAQLPRLPVTLHAWHVPHEAVLQQTPSTQLLPVRQSFELVHAWPRRFLLPQRFVVGSQMFGDRQSVSAVHAALQAVVPLHMYGAHEIELAAWQVPVPLQVRPEVNVDELAGHEGAAQEVLAS
jgi:hypothetical protein